MRADEERDYVEYVQVRTLALRRSAFRLCGDWHHAYDLVQITFIQLYRHWRKAVVASSMDAYVSKILINAFLAEQRKWWQRRVRTGADPLETVKPSADHDGAVDLMVALARLAPGQRAVLVLRYFEGLDVETTAEVLGCSPWTIKKHTRSQGTLGHCSLADAKIHNLGWRRFGDVIRPKRPGSSPSDPGILHVDVKGIFGKARSGR